MSEGIVMRHAFEKAVAEWENRGNKPLSYYRVVERLNRPKKPRRKRSRK